MLAIAISVAGIALGQIGTTPRIVGEIYTIDNAASGNSVWLFDRDIDGSLVASRNFSTQGNGTGSGLGSQGAVVLSQDGQWLFVVNAGSNDVSIFRVNNTGLTFANKTSSHGIAPISLTVNGNWVYVLNNGSATVPANIAGFALLNGTLNYIAGSNQTLSGKANTSPEQIGFNPRGTILVVTEKAANITDIFKVDQNGNASKPALMPSLSPGPYGFAFTPQGYLVLSEAVSNTLSSFAVYDNASFRILSGSMPDFGSAPCWVAVTGNGYVYTSNAHGGTISAYNLSKTGMLNLFSSIAAQTSIPTLDLAITQDNQFLYAVNGNSITGFQIYPDGSLSNVTMVNNLPSSITGLAAS